MARSIDSRVRRTGRIRRKEWVDAYAALTPSSATAKTSPSIGAVSPASPRPESRSSQPVDGLIALQRSVGNRAMQRLVVQWFSLQRRRNSPHGSTPDLLSSNKIASSLPLLRGPDD